MDGLNKRREEQKNGIKDGWNKRRRTNGWMLNDGGLEK